VPSPGTCDPNGPYLSTPRAFYDPTGARFWVASLQVEGALGLNSCPEQALTWIALSQTSDPTGLWNVYSFDLSASTTNVATYLQFGFNPKAIFYSANMVSRDGSAFAYAEIYAANKDLMEAGSPVTASSGVVVWAIAHPVDVPSLSKVIVTTTAYVLASKANGPGCPLCIETFDTRITGTPVFRSGMISFALETGVDNGTGTNVPGIFWGQIQPTVTNGTITGATVFQSGYYS